MKIRIWGQALIIATLILSQQTLHASEVKPNFCIDRLSRLSTYVGNKFFQPVNSENEEKLKPKSVKDGFWNQNSRLKITPFQGIRNALVDNPLYYLTGRTSGPWIRKPYALASGVVIWTAVLFPVYETIGLVSQYEHKQAMETNGGRYDRLMDYDIRFRAIQEYRNIELTKIPQALSPDQRIEIFKKIRTKAREMAYQRRVQLYDLFQAHQLNPLEKVKDKRKIYEMALAFVPSELLVNGVTEVSGQVLTDLRRAKGPELSDEEITGLVEVEDDLQFDLEAALQLIVLDSTGEKSLIVEPRWDRVQAQIQDRKQKIILQSFYQSLRYEFETKIISRDQFIMAMQTELLWQAIFKENAILGVQNIVKGTDDRVLTIDDVRISILMALLSNGPRGQLKRP